MEEDVDTVLDREIEAVKQQVDVLEHDIAALMAAEREGEARDELLRWLQAKKERQAVLTDEERHRHLLSHLEEAYRNAAISQETYDTVKRRSRELLER